MKEIIIIAGPNGAGKTSFANHYFPADQEGLEFVNADEIARTIAQAGETMTSLNLRAGRLMLEQISSLTSAGREFMFETTLASLTYARKIPRWRSDGYTVCLIYLRLPTIEAAIDRVRRRVAAGGHDIPDATIRERFSKSLNYLNELYKPIVDEWYIWNSLEGDFQLAEAWDD
ncbi:MAG: AAA family ATPase [Hyphomicrobiaceae bacterium]|nr:AAA family ATPase [Hyphomicrobiaceae bacterium]MCC0011447.1 AAA family ATPase [Hyphomicrobiaceae bacterium]